MEMKSFILKYASKIMFYDVNIACYQRTSRVWEGQRERPWKRGNVGERENNQKRELHTQRESLSSRWCCFPSRERKRREEKEKDGRGEEGEG